MGDWALGSFSAVELKVWGLGLRKGGCPESTPPFEHFVGDLSFWIPSCRAYVFGPHKNGYPNIRPGQGSVDMGAVHMEFPLWPPILIATEFM